MTIFHQSEITSWGRCPAASGYEASGQPRQQSSALAYGSVLHFAILEVFERLRHRDGITIEDATKAAIESFRHFWHPLNIDNICQPVDYWLPRQTFTDLLVRGEDEIRWYAAEVAGRKETLLATEYSFRIHLPGTWDEDAGEPHILVGTIDRLSLRQERGITIVETGDVKTGKDYTFLRENTQFSAYSLATTQRDFWFGAGGEDGFGDMAQELWDKTQDSPRRGWWISTKSKKVMDAGWRGPEDYRRFIIAVEQIDASRKNDIYPLSISGENCHYCEFRQICAGNGVPDDDHGAPALLLGTSTPSTPPRRTSRRS